MADEKHSNSGQSTNFDPVEAERTLTQGTISFRNGSQQPPIVVTSVRSGLGSPTALAIGAFATTLTTLGCSLMEWRGVTTTNVFIGNFFFVAGTGMLISAQWELVHGNSFGYTVLSAFGLFYAGFGAIVTPLFGVTDAYRGNMQEYNNALGFFVLLWTVFNTFFLIGSLPINLVYIGIFATVELAFGLVAASYFAAADEKVAASEALKKAGGAFAFVSGMLGYYTLGHLMCQEATFWSWPMGDTSHLFKRRTAALNEERPAPQHEAARWVVRVFKAALFPELAVVIADFRYRRLADAFVSHSALSLDPINVLYVARLLQEAGFWKLDPLTPVYGSIHSHFLHPSPPPKMWSLLVAIGLLREIEGYGTIEPSPNAPLRLAVEGMGSLGTNGAAYTPNYEEHHQKFLAAGQPQGEQAWVQRAADVAAIFTADGAQRDLAGAAPFKEVELLKSTGLLKVLGPKQYGGGGEGWDVGYKVIREVAKGDGSLGMLLGYHLLWSTTANVVGNDEQKERIQKLIIENNYFVGGAVNPRDSDLSITSEGEEIVFNGSKNFNTGGVISDLTILEGVYQGTEDHIFTIVKTQQPGIQFAYNWDNIGMRLTESGSVKIENIRVPWSDAFGWDPAAKKPLDSVLKIPFASLLLPTIQLVFSSFYIGVAWGALETAAGYTRKSTRPWPYTPEPAAAATSEFYILERYGGWFADLRAVTALADVAGKHVADLYAAHGEKRDVSERLRGEVAEWVCSTKIKATDVGLDVTAGVFEVTGSRATSRKVLLDRFWRDVRTHSLHDPVALKRTELGRFLLKDEIPTPTWYT